MSDIKDYFRFVMQYLHTPCQASIIQAINNVYVSDLQFRCS